MSEEIYRALYDDIPSMYFTLDADGTVMSVNRFGADQLGFSREELVGQPVFGVFHPEDRDAVREKLRACSRDPGQTFEWQLRKHRRDGRLMWVHEHARAVSDADGRTLILIACEDITEQRRTEGALQDAHDELERRISKRTAELERQRAFLRQIIDVDPNFIFAKDRQGRFVLVNQAVADAYGTTVEQLIGKTDAHFNDNPEEVESFRRMDLEVMNKLEERFIPEEVITDSDGKIRWLQTVKRPLIGSDGTAHMVLGSATDITARRQMNEKLRVSQAALLRSQEDLRDLAGRLLSAQEEERRRLAREVHDDLSQRLSGLAIMAGGIEQSLEGVIDRDSMYQLQEISQELTSLSGDVQSLSRQLHPAMLEALGLEDALRNECRQVSERFDMNVAFESRDVPDGLSPQSGIVFYRIAQEALHNVASHANTQNANVSLAADGTWLRLTVSDPGAGFDPAHPGRKRGIGLASMEERARLIRAELSIESRPGEGTTILLKAPLAQPGTVGPDAGPPHPTDTGC